MKGLNAIFEIEILFYNEQPKKLYFVPIIITFSRIPKTAISYIPAFNPEVFMESFQNHPSDKADTQKLVQSSCGTQEVHSNILN